MPVTGHNREIGQASDQANEVGRVGAGPLREGQIPGKAPNSAKRFTSHPNGTGRHQPCQPAPGQPTPTITGDSGARPAHNGATGGKRTKNLDTIDTWGVQSDINNREHSVILSGVQS